MTVLTNVELHRALEMGELVIEPRPKGSPGMPDSAYDEASIEMHIADYISVPKDGVQAAIDPVADGDIQTTLDTMLDRVRIPDTGYVLPPGGFVLATCKERVEFKASRDGKNQIMGRIEGRSRFARCGILVHATAPTLHPLWGGKITFELKNVGYFGFVLHRDLDVGQLIVERTEGEVVKHDGIFDGQQTEIGGK